MSMTAQIATLEASGKLLRYVPRSRWPPKRALFLARKAAKALDDPNSATNLLGMRGLIEADLVRWTKGDRIYAEGGKPRYMRRLAPPPPEVWEIRVTEPRVHVRLFGRFAAPDVFIMTHIYTRQLLGKFGSPQWHMAMRDCVRCWDTLFPNCAPFVANSIHDYVTENCDAFPI